MRIFLCNEVVRDLDFVEQCRFARETGYDGLEIAPFTLGPEPHRLTPATIRELRTVAEGEGVAIAGLHWLLAAPGGLSITSDDPAVRKETDAVGRALVVLCAQLGGTYLIHGSPGQRKLEPGREHEGRRHGTDYFASMALAAQDAGVDYLIEPLSRTDTGFINTVGEAVEIANTIGSPSLATMIDCYATAADAGDIAGQLETWLPRGVIRHVHFNDDNKRGPGEGSLDFARILDTLAKLDYAGAGAVEPFVYTPDGTSCAARAIGYLRGLERRLG